MTLKAYQNAMDEITRLREHLRMYEAECSGLRAAGFENAQDLFTSYEGVRQQLEAAKAERDNAGEAIEFLRNELYVARTDLAARDLVIKQLREALSKCKFDGLNMPIAEWREVCEIAAPKQSEQGARNDRT